MDGVWKSGQWMPKNFADGEIVMKVHGIEFVEVKNCQTSMHVALAKISPAMAAAMLSDADNYRHTDDRRVAKYSEVIGSGEWEVNGETIKLDADGKAVDGKHRLEACIKSKTAFTSLVALGVANVLEADRGKPRSLSDHLNRLGHRNRSNLAATLAFLFRWEQGKTLYTHGVDGYPTIAQADDMLARHPDITEYASMACRARRVVGPSLISSVAYVGACAGGVSMRVAEEWIDGIANGVEGNHRDPRHVVREMFLQDRTQNNRAAKSKRTFKDKLAIAIKSWNAFVLGRDANNASIRWRSAGVRPEAFPEFVEKHEVALLLAD